MLIGTTIDELIRHHPSLKNAVFDSLISTLGKIEDFGNTYELPEISRHWYQLLSADARVDEGDVAMQDVETEAGEAPMTDNDPNEIGGGSPVEDSSKLHDNLAVSFIDVLGRVWAVVRFYVRYTNVSSQFLEGLFQHPQHCKDFLTQTDVLERIGRLTALPCFPYDFANNVASDSLVQVMRTMADASATRTFQFLLKLVKSSLKETKDFWGGFSQQSVLIDMVDFTSTQALSTKMRMPDHLCLRRKSTCCPASLQNPSNIASPHYPTFRCICNCRLYPWPSLFFVAADLD